MRNKGLILFFTILIAVVCLYCLSFTVATWSVERKAKQAATEILNDAVTADYLNVTAGEDPMLKKHLSDSIYDHAEAHFLAVMKDSVIFLGKTYKECKYKEINLGLDLKGGMNVTLEVSIPEVVKSLANNTEDPLFINTYNKAVEIYTTDQESFIDVFANTFNQEKQVLGMGNAALRTYFGDRANKKTANDAEILSWIKDETNQIVDRTFKVLTTRIDRFGVAQPNVQRLQGGRILVELPGIKEPERVTELLKSTAKLEFWTVYNDLINGQPIQELFRQADIQLKSQMTVEEKEMLAVDSVTDAAVAALTTADSLDLEEDEEVEDFSAMGPILSKSLGSDGTVIGFFRESDQAEINRLLPHLQKILGMRDVVFYWGDLDKNFKGFPLVPLKRNNDRVGPVLSSETIDGARVVRSARQDIDQTNRVVVTMSMEDRATDEWRRITRTAVETPGKTTMIAIVLDNFVYSYPVIRSEIPNGNSEISGNFTIDEASDLATVLNSGNLEASVNVVQSEVVGPTLGQESINSGLISFLLAFVLVIVYMFVFYNKAGLVADMALFSNVFFIMGVLASLGAVLTLPGIAGIVLTLGMAVDANVIIYERIREELRSGKGLRMAVDEGFKNALSAIIDGNITTLITAIVLYILGSGPVQGFATTLIIGIASSLFTAILLSRLVFERMLKKGKNISFSHSFTANTFAHANYNIIGKKKIFYMLSIILSVISIISFCTLKLSPGIDFTGGRNFVVRFDHDVSSSDIRTAIAEEFGGNPEVKTFGGNDQVRITTNYKIDSNDPVVDKETETKLYNALKGFYDKTNITQDDFTQQLDPRGIQSSQKVQPTIARELLMSAIWAVLIALVLIFIYIALRFRNWQFGLGGVIALAHDTMLTIGLFSLFWKVMPFSMEIDQSFIAAILTVIGYSINNVVVIYDRMRENLSLYPKRENSDNFNSAINSTLGRTVNTAGSTLIVLLAIFLFGGEVIRGFVFAMGAGILFGTYSSIFISGPIAHDLFANKKVRRIKNNK
jgi:SecD/SecF fusion protein